MAADNTTLNTGSGGDDLRTLGDASGQSWPIGVAAYPTTVSAGANVLTIPTALALADGLANPTTLLGGSCILASNGTTWDRVPNGGGVEAKALRVTIASDSSGVLSIDDNGGSITVDGTVTANLSATDNAVLDSIAASVGGTLTVGSHAVTNAGTFAVQSTLSAETTKVIGTINVAAAQTIAVTNAGTFATQATLQAGTAEIGKLAAGVAEIGNVKNSGTFATQAACTNAGTFVVQIDGAALTALQLIDDAISGSEMQCDIVAALPTGANTVGAVNVKPTTSGGLSISRTLSAATNNATSVKSSAGQVFGYIISNNNAASVFFKMYNKASAPAPATDDGLLMMTIEIPPASTGHVEFVNGIAFGTGIAFAVTGAIGDTDNTSIGASETVIHVLYS